MPVAVCATLTLSRAAPDASAPGVCAWAISTMASSAVIVPNICFRISRLPASGLLRPRIPSVFAVIALRHRPSNALGYVPRQWLAQLVLKCFFEDDRISRDFHHVTVEYRIVLAEEVRFVHCVNDHGDHSVVRPHHALERNLVNCQAALSGAAS